ncbi:hypothetical protein [Agrococcus sp. BE272]|uniref:hypothetical protein n=1 Tax=Agrococcus sp. BE272 TaxID=2817727 RepID=UPI002866D781|nr:hypothetical protein [Agrococcus sp. BE272]MDR7235040.1 hypothetical protein [Agrococcus sp. BE272]
MRPLRLQGRPPLVYVGLALLLLALSAVCIWDAVDRGTVLWVVAVLACPLVVVFVLLTVRAATARFALELDPEPVLELGSAFGRTRTPLRSIARVRLGHVPGGYGPALDLWELIGHDGARLARASDLGIPFEGLRALRTELALARIPVGRD